MLNNFKLLPLVSLLLCIWTLTGARNVGLIKRANGNTGSSSPPRGHDHGHAYEQPGSPSHESQHQELGPPTSRSERAGNKLGRFHNHPATRLARMGVVSAAKYVSRPITKNIDASTKSNVKGALSNFGHSVAHASPSIEKFTGHFKKGKDDRAREFSDHMDSIGF